jgi:hypothetical protein
MMTARFQVFEFWANSQQMVVILLDKLMTYVVVGNQAIINCMFAEDFHRLFLRYDLLPPSPRKRKQAAAVVCRTHGAL